VKHISMDIGGTFTDFVLYDEDAGTYETSKVPSTPGDPAQGVLNGVDALLDSLETVSFTVHGSSIALNTLLQRRGESVLLLTTAGTEDVYHIARGSRSRMYDIRYRRPAPLVPRDLIVGIRGRLDYRGEEIEPLSLDDLAQAAARVEASGVKSVAVAFLYSYLNAAHEEKAAEALAERLPGVSIALSHTVAREWREYERTSSAVLDAYVGPTLTRYLGRLVQEMGNRRLSVPLHVMQSSGGVMTAAAATGNPLQTIISGPVGGTMGGVALSRLLDRPNLICIDMGGTSFDVSLVVNGKADQSTEASIEGLPFLIPIVNIHSIGAGGGSVAFLEGGGLRVGPQSAGADPGPACYGKGGTLPTVTDANLVLGRLDREYFLGGRMPIDAGAAERVLEPVAAELELSTTALAGGIVAVINAKMAQAIRTLTVEQGIDARDFAIVAFGGAGPLHAAFLAEELEVEEVIVPRFPGTFSAWGMLQTAIRHDFATPFLYDFDDVTPAALEAELDVLRARGREMLEQENVAPEDMRSQASAEMRYERQEYTINVPFPQAGLHAPTFLDDLADAFHAAYKTRYGHSNPGAPIQIVALRLASFGAHHHRELEPLSRESASDPGFTTRTAVFDGREHDTLVARRERLAPGTTLPGPAIVEEPTAGTVVPPGWVAEVDAYGFLRIRP
jgi:N-methylhydantoinase A